MICIPIPCYTNQIQKKTNIGMGSITLTKLDTNANAAISSVTLTKASSLMQPSTNSFSVKVPSPKKISEPKGNKIIYFINHHISFLMIYYHSVQIT